MTIQYDKVLSDSVISALLDKGVVQSCLTCTHFVSGVCTIANEAPPAKIIVYGCEAWVMDIPF